MRKTGAQNQRIEREMLHIMLRQNPLAQFVSLLLGFVTVYILFDYTTRGVIFGWLMALGLLVILRLWLIRLYRRRLLNRASGSSPNALGFAAGLFLTGSAWGSLPWLLTSPEPQAVLFIAVVVVGLAAGAVAALALNQFFFMAYTLPQFVSLAAYFLLQPIDKGWAIAGALALFYFGLRKAAGIVGEEVREYVRLQMNAADEARRADMQATALREANEELQRRRHFVENLLRITNRSDRTSLEKLQALLQFGCESLDLRLGIIARIHDGYYDVYAMYATGPQADAREGDRFPLENTICVHTVKSDDVFAFSNATEARNRLHPMYGGVMAGSYIGARVMLSDGMFGTLNFSDVKERKKPFSSAEYEFVRLLANWLSSEIANLQSARALKSKEQQLSTLADGLPCGMASISADRRYVYANRLFQEAFTRDGEPLVGRKLENAHSMGGYRMLQQYLDAALGGEEQVFEFEPPGANSERRIYRFNLVPDRNDANEVTGCFALALDITDDLQRRDELERKASLDTLTGVYNRQFMEDTLARLTGDRRKRKPVYVALVDLDGFKEINDTAGHQCGDAVLREVAQVLRRDLRKEDIVARYGGDEFIVIMHCTDNDDLVDTCENMLERLRASEYEYEGKLFAVDASAGATRIVRGESVEALLSRVDRAMYSAKQKGKGMIEYEFSDSAEPAGSGAISATAVKKTAERKSRTRKSGS